MMLSRDLRRCLRHSFLVVTLHISLEWANNLQCRWPDQLKEFEIGWPGPTNLILTICGQVCGAITIYYVDFSIYFVPGTIR